MSRRKGILLFIVAISAFVGTAPTQVVNVNTTCADTGLLVWGQVGGINAASVPIRNSCGNAVTVPGISNASGPGAVNQAVAFSVGHAPALSQNVNWSAPAAITLGSIISVDVKVWILYKSATCDLACVQTKMALFLAWANGRLDVERTGIQLRAAGANWVEDKSPLTSVQPEYAFVRFTENQDCANVPTGLGPTFRQSNILNLYIVQTVDVQTSRGYTCTEPLGIATPFASSFVGWKAENGTMLHELLHNFDLHHEADLLNMMMGASSYRRYLSEGQIFRIHYSRDSAMTLLAFPGKPPGIPSTTCPALLGSADCPASNATVWQDQ